MLSPFQITVYTGNFVKIGFIGDPIDVSADIQCNALSTLSFSLPGDHLRIPDLLQDDARIVVFYNDEHLISGPIRRYSASGPAFDVVWTFTVEDDFRLFSRVLGWINPAGSLAEQGLDNLGEYVKTGAAETILKLVVKDNAIDRIRLPVICAPDLQRGQTITVAYKFNQLADKLFPALEQAGLSATVRQVDDKLVVDVRETVRYPVDLTESGGAITAWSIDRTGPTATRVIYGDNGVGSDRNFARVMDAGLEASSRDMIEVFKDASSSEDANAQLASANEVLKDGAPKNGLTLTLAETDSFRYGGGVVYVGDRVRLRVASDIVIEDILQRVTILWNAEDGVVVTPVVGDAQDAPSIISRAINSIGRRVRELGSSR